MWRTGYAKPLLLAAAVALVAVFVQPGSCQSAGPFCDLVYYTLTSTIMQTVVQTSVAVVQTYVEYTTAVTNYMIEGDVTHTFVTTLVTYTPSTTTTTLTLTNIQTAVTPGGVVANFSCSVPQVQPPTVTLPVGPALGGYPSDALSLLIAAAAIGIMAAGIVSSLPRSLIYMLAGAAAVNLLASAYAPLAPVAQAVGAVVIFAAVVFFALSR